MIDASVKRAVNVSEQTLQTVYEGAPIEDVLLEEIERSEDEQYWFITLGFSVPASVPLTGLSGSLAQQLARPQYVRKYKVFKVRTDTGEVASMKIRELGND